MNKPLSPSLALNEHIADSYAQSGKAPAQVRIVLQMLRKMAHGALRLECPDGSVLHFGDSSAAVTLTLNSWEPCLAAMRSGDIGFAESYIAGEWQTDNLAGLLELFIHNRSVLENAIYGSWWGSLLYRVRHLFNRNSRAGSRRNIHAHYDIGNAFYTLWLDPSMTYSSALFTAPGMTLQQAQAIGPTAEYDPLYSTPKLTGQQLVELIYNDLKAAKAPARR